MSRPAGNSRRDRNSIRERPKASRDERECTYPKTYSVPASFRAKTAGRFVVNILLYVPGERAWRLAWRTPSFRRFPRNSWFEFVRENSGAPNDGPGGGFGAKEIKRETRRPSVVDNVSGPVAPRAESRDVCLPKINTIIMLAHHFGAGRARHDSQPSIFCDVETTWTRFPSWKTIRIDLNVFQTINLTVRNNVQAFGCNFDFSKCRKPESLLRLNTKCILCARKELF